jgi:AcrR family transcriptional regulator
MGRKRPDDRLARLVECGARVFTERGYRRTQMADVARAMGVAPGTLYLYVQSKEALFDLVVQRAFLDNEAALPRRLPIATPRPGLTLRHVRRRSADESHLPCLDAALRRRRPVDPRAELAEVVHELHGFIAHKRGAIRLLERCALDWPQLAEVFYTDVRRGLLRRLTSLLERRMAQRQLRRVAHPAAAARLILETISWFAMHRHGDQDAANIDDATAEETVVDALVNAYAPR